MHRFMGRDNVEVQMPVGTDRQAIQVYRLVVVVSKIADES